MVNLQQKTPIKQQNGEHKNKQNNNKTTEW